MRILHIISGIDPQNGGPTTVLGGLLPAQVAAGIDVTLLATWKIPDGLPVADALRAKGVKVIHVGPATGKLSRHPDLAKETNRAVAASDIVHIHGLWEEAQHLAARAAQKLGVPYIITPHGMLAPWSLSQSRLAKRIYLWWRLRKNLDRATAINFTTEDERDQVKPLEVKAEPFIERLGLDLAEFEELPPKGAFRSRWPQLGGKPFVLFLGRINYKKGLDILIPAFAAAKLNDVFLVIAGPDRDGYEPAVRQMVAKHGIGDRVVFTGMLHGRQRLEAYVDAAIFALTSHQENFGITVIEAMICGCPVLISDQVNIHPQITAASAGDVIPVDIERARAAVVHAMNDAGWRANAGAKGRAYALEHYDWRAVAEDWKHHYQRLIGAKPTLSSNIARMENVQLPPRITVVTPSFNQAQFLVETLRSVIAQKQFIHEYFVIDGGSTDGSVDLIRRHADNIDFWISEKDAGQADAIQKGFSRATGDYLFWLNSDDVLLPGAMQRIRAALDAHPTWDALTGYHVRVDSESRILSCHRTPTEGPNRARWGIHHVIQQTCVFRRSLYEKVGPLDSSLHCVLDTELWCRMFDAGPIWGHIPEYLAAFRQHAAAKGSDSKWAAMYREEEAMLRVKYPQYCADNFKHKVGLLSYRAGQMLSGRHLLALRDTRRFRGKTLTEVFREPSAATSSL